MSISKTDLLQFYQITVIRFYEHHYKRIVNNFFMTILIFSRPKCATSNKIVRHFKLKYRYQNDILNMTMSAKSIIKPLGLLEQDMCVMDMPQKNFKEMYNASLLYGIHSTKFFRQF